jgi:hypothetical protein
MMVGSWPCKVLSEIRIIGRHVSELVHEDMGKTTATEPEDEKDPKKARVVLSKGCEVVKPGHSRLIGAVAKVTDRGENSGNSSRVNQFSKTEQHYLSQVSRVNQDSNMDQQEDWIGWVSQDNSMDRQANRVSQVSQNNSTDRRADRVSRLTGLAVLATRSKK